MKAAFTHSILALVLLASVGTSLGAEKPKFTDDPSVFCAFYGKSESKKFPGGEKWVWKKGSFEITLVRLNIIGRILGITKLPVDLSPLSEKEVFYLADRFCGRKEWKLTESDEKSEIFVSTDFAFMIIYQKKSGFSPDSDGIGCVTIMDYTMTKGIEDL